MPPLRHSFKDRPYDVMESEVVDWLFDQPEVREYAYQYIRDSAKSMGAIKYDKDTGRWSGDPSAIAKINEARGRGRPPSYDIEVLVAAVQACEEEPVLPRIQTAIFGEGAGCDFTQLKRMLNAAIKKGRIRMEKPENAAWRFYAIPQKDDGAQPAAPATPMMEVEL